MIARRGPVESERVGLVSARLERVWFDTDDEDDDEGSEPDWWEWWADSGQYVTGRSST